MPRTNVPEARNRILQAAVNIFAAKSYDGSRIEEIAQLANVPKSLIYYHFKSKEDILAALIEKFMTEYRAMLGTAERGASQSQAEHLAGKLHRLYRDFAFANTDLVRVMLIDSLKKSNTSPSVFQVAEALVEAEAAALGPEQAEGFDKNERMIAQFFTGVMPLFAYLCFADSWVGHFGIDKESFDRHFMKAIAGTFGAGQHD